MTDDELRARAHDLDATLRVGKRGPEAVLDELNDQLADRNLVKVRFLRAARAGTDVEALAAEMAPEVSAEVVETRGNTAVFHR
ncbi:MAG: YhbY family RNA-binding protein [Haloferacaceae archaeon]